MSRPSPRMLRPSPPTSPLPCATGRASPNSVQTGILPFYPYPFRMLILHAPHPQPEIAERLHELVVAHRIHTGDTTTLWLDAWGDRIEGKTAILHFLQELEAELVFDRSYFQSDACYLDPDTGKVC